MQEASSIPKFVIDLSLPAQDRYTHIIPDFQDAVHSCELPSLFHNLLQDLTGTRLGKCLASLSPYILRRVHSDEETAELTGISKAINIPMHILVAFNVLLDLLLGCTSGGVRALDIPKSKPVSTRMLHFRTLDWGMDQLRHLIVEFDFIRRTGGPVVATTITYLGYVGVLTGVRKGLSISLNFRPYHAKETTRQRLSFRWNQALVVLGFRQSISSALRNILLEEYPGSDAQTRQGRESVNASNLAKSTSDEYVQEVLKRMSTSQSTSAYIILCQPERVFLVEKDHRRASIRDSDTFLTAYNHDVKDENDPSRLHEAAAELEQADDAIGMTELVGLSLDRKRRLEEMWREKSLSCRRRYKQQRSLVTQRDVIKFLEDEEISNDETHYAVIMDPREGKVIWRRMYEASDGQSSESSV
ncbi:n-acylsphingosine amidohydrolase [Fusarium longipes]|uniref:ceramidase n=1 Tax=Fusarium longipes TaxID=694270 RepID=A0A395T4L3_9HYPO|nr:n-acylsphingosine amidohydrolase [Fusarium longipes]